MFFVYVDESGDIGLTNSPSKFFCLSAYIVHESQWRKHLDLIIGFRRDLRKRYGFKLREEIHSSEFIRKPGIHPIPKSLRLRMLRDALKFQAGLENLNLVNVVIEKSKCSDQDEVFTNAWKYLIQRIDNTLTHNNFPGSENSIDSALLFVDRTDEKKLRNISRRLNVFNPVPNTGNNGYRRLEIKHLVEDAVHRDSKHSYFIQLADINAFFLKQYFQPSRYIKKKGGNNYFKLLEPVLCVKASRKGPLGIVKY